MEDINKMGIKELKKIMMNNDIDFKEKINEIDARKLIKEYIKNNNKNSDEIINNNYFFSNFTKANLKNLCEAISLLSNNKLTCEQGGRNKHHELFKFVKKNIYVFKDIDNNTINKILHSKKEELKKILTEYQSVENYINNLKLESSERKKLLGYYGITLKKMNASEEKEKNNLLIEKIKNKGNKVKDLINIIENNLSNNNLDDKENKIEKKKVLDKHYDEEINLPNIKIKYIYHIADIHIRKDRFEEYEIVFNRFYDDIKNNKETKKENTVIVICGDVYHEKKGHVSKTLIMFSKFIQNLSKLFNVICIMGNHDKELKNDNTDYILPFSGLNNFYYLRKSGEYKCGNVIFVVSHLDDNEINECKKTDPSKTYIYLYHGSINGSIYFNGIKDNNSKITLKSFGDFDYLLLGDIHKHQYFGENVAYPGSLIQQDVGESLNGHGYILWDIENKTSKFYEVDNDYGFAKIKFENKTIKPKNFKNIEELLKKKYLTLIYEMKDDDYQSLAENKNKLEKNLRDNGVEIIKSKDLAPQFHEKNIITEIKDTSFDTEMDTYFNSKNCDDETIKNLKTKNEDFMKLAKFKNDIIKSSWQLVSLEFKNIISYGNNHINLIKFNRKGYYTVFGSNAIGKTSIINIIKWGFFGNASNFTEHDILNSNSSYGYIKIIFKIYDQLWTLTKEIKKENTGKNKCEKELFWNNELYRNKEADNKLSFLIGSYDDFELISSINSSDLGIIKKNKSALTNILHKLFKIEKYELLYDEVKDRLTELKKTFKSHEEKIKNINILDDKCVSLDNEIKKYNEEINKIDRNLLIEKESNLISKKTNLKIPEKKNDHSTELENIKSKLIFDESIDYEKLDELIKNNLDEQSKLMLKLNNFPINPIKNLEDPTNLITKIEEEIQSIDKKLNDENIIKLKKNIKENNDLLFKKTKLLNNVRKNLNIDEINLCKNKNISELDKIKLDINDTETKLIEIKSDIENISLKIIPMKIDIKVDEKQSIKYQKDKDDIINLLSNVIETNDISLIKINNIKNIKSLLTENNLNELYKIQQDNKNYENKLSELKKTEKKLKTQLNSLNDTKKDIDEKITICEKDSKDYYLSKEDEKIENEINDIKNKISDEEEKIKLCEENIKKFDYLNNELILLKKNLSLFLEEKEIIKNNKNNEPKREKIKNKIDNLKKTYNKMKDDKEKYKSYLNLKDLQNQYENYLTENKKYESDKIEQDNIKKDLENVKKEIKKYDEILIKLENKKEQYTESLKELNELKNIQIEKKNINHEIDLLEKYKEMINKDNGIPSKIFEKKIPLLENEINNVLNKYTNFNISIEYDKTSKGDNKGITIYQFKKNEPGNKMTIASCSGYETFILNIAFKLAIKRICYINSPNFICIDEVFEKIAKDNYNNLNEMFNILYDNFDIVLIITHLEDIKEMIDISDNRINEIKIERTGKNSKILDDDYYEENDE